MSSVHGLHFTNITGASALALSFTASAAEHGNQYCTKFTNFAGIVDNHAATLTVA